MSMSQREKLVYIAVFAVIALPCAVVALNPDLPMELLGLRDYEIEDPAASQAAAEKIILLLEDFMSQTGTYPKTLEELENHYHIQIMDVPSGYRKWQYHYRKRNNFVLTFGANDDYYPCEYYESSTGEWSSDY